MMHTIETFSKLRTNLQNLEICFSLHRLVQFKTVGGWRQLCFMGLKLLVDNNQAISKSSKL